MVNKYYEKKKKNREKLQKEAWERYLNLFEEIKGKMQKSTDRYKNLCEEKKEKKRQNHWV